MKLMDFLEKCLKSPSMTHEIDGLFGKNYKKSIITHVIDGLFGKLFKKSINNT